MSWDEIAPDFTVSFDNIDTLLVAGRRSHSMGLLNTLWTDDDQMLMEMSWPGIAYGAAAAWQQAAMQQQHFLPTYARIQYPKAIAPDFASASTSLNQAERACMRLWAKRPCANPGAIHLPRSSLNALHGKYDDLHHSRMEAEDRADASLCNPRQPRRKRHIWTRFFSGQADRSGGNEIHLCRRDRLGMAVVAAASHAPAVRRCAGQGVSNQTHSRMMDMMDGVTGTRELYRQAWLEQYTPYRHGHGVGPLGCGVSYSGCARRRNFEDFRRSFRTGDALPSLHDLLITLA